MVYTLANNPQYSPFHEKTKETHTTRAPSSFVLFGPTAHHLSPQSSHGVVRCSCWWWIHIYYDLVKRITNKKEKKQTYQGGPNDVSFGPTARHLSPPSRHGIHGHGGGSYIYDLVKRINKQKKTYFRWVVWARLHCDQALFVVCGGGEYIYI